MQAAAARAWQTRALTVSTGRALAELMFTAKQTGIRTAPHLGVRACAAANAAACRRAPGPVRSGAGPTAGGRAHGPPGVVPDRQAAESACRCDPVAGHVSEHDRGHDERPSARTRTTGACAPRPFSTASSIPPGGYPSHRRARATTAKRRRRSRSSSRRSPAPSCMAGPHPRGATTRPCPGTSDGHGVPQRLGAGSSPPCASSRPEA